MSNHRGVSTCAFSDVRWKRNFQVCPFFWKIRELKLKISGNSSFKRREFLQITKKKEISSNHSHLLSVIFVFFNQIIFECYMKLTHRTRISPWRTNLHWLLFRKYIYEIYRLNFCFTSILVKASSFLCNLLIKSW